MKKLFISLALILSFFAVRANDGAFYSEGTHLIPITETDISVQKEILTVKRYFNGNIWNQKYFVTVYYEFFNPGEGKDLLVGFEALPPSDGSDEMSYPNHPDIANFKVILNDEELPYEVAHVAFTDYNWTIGEYYKDGQFLEISEEKRNKNLLDGYYDSYYYVYHFNAHFKKGLNIIQHTYTFNGSEDNISDYIFSYVLTAANRWANNGIDDFTLILDMGDMESFAVMPNFFNGLNEWSIDGKGKIGKDHAVFHIQEGKAVFHKTNFHPEGELIVSKSKIGMTGEDYFDYIKMQYLTFHDELTMMIDDGKMTPEQKRILRNLPFAYRGYVFKNKDLQKFFESTEWYIPNPNYKDNFDELNQYEKDWIEYWKK